MKSKFVGTLSWIQGIYFLITGLWPILDIDSFMNITGLKTDIWLVKTVGALIIPIGLSMLCSAIRKELNLSLIIVFCGAAIGLGIIDVVYVGLNIIRPIYLADAVAEIVFSVAWAYIAISKNTY